MKWDKGINWRELNDAEYDDSEMDDYDGPVPPSNKVLAGELKKAWVTETANGDPMIKTLFVADGNTGDRKQYNGCPIWDQVLFTMPQVKFKWQPWLDALGITLADVKNKTIIGDEETTGDRIEKIGTVSFAKPIPIRVKTQKERSEEYGEQARVGRWLPPADTAPDEDDDDFEEDEDDEDQPF